MKQYTTLLFDADGTLLDFDQTESNALQETFHQYHYPFNELIHKRYLEINDVFWSAYEEGRMSRDEVIYTRFKKLFKEFGIHDDGIKFEDDYQKALGRGHDLVEHALDVIRVLEKDFDLYIVSNGVVATQYQRLKESGLDKHFKDIFISEEIGYQKPKKEYFEYCFQSIPEKDTRNMLIIGDSLSSDMQGGYNAGIDTCWYNPKHKINTKKLEITYEIENLKELFQIVERKF